MTTISPFYNKCNKLLESGDSSKIDMVVQEIHDTVTKTRTQEIKTLLSSNDRMDLYDNICFKKYIEKGYDNSLVRIFNDITFKENKTLLLKRFKENGIKLDNRMNEIEDIDLYCKDPKKFANIEEVIETTKMRIETFNKRETQAIELIFSEGYSISDIPIFDTIIPYANGKINGEELIDSIHKFTTTLRKSSRFKRNLTSITGSICLPDKSMKVSKKEKPKTGLGLGGRVRVPHRWGKKKLVNNF